MSPRLDIFLRSAIWFLLLLNLEWVVVLPGTGDGAHRTPVLGGLSYSPTPRVGFESPALQQAPWERFRIAKPSQVDEGTAKVSDGPWLEGSGDQPLLTEVEDLHVTESGSFSALKSAWVPTVHRGRPSWIMTCPSCTTWKVLVGTSTQNLSPRSFMSHAAPGDVQRGVGSSALHCTIQFTRASHPASFTGRLVHAFGKHCHALCLL